MKQSVDYGQDVYYNKTCGNEITNPDDLNNKIFDLLDVEDAFEEGRSFPNMATIDRIFELNIQYIKNCRANSIMATSTERNNYIYDNWDTVCSRDQMYPY